MESTTTSDAAVRTYEVQSCLGRGAFGEVYRAEMIDGGLRQTVALKVLAPAVVDPNAQSAERLRDEAMFLGGLRHKALPKVYTITELDGRLTLVMEYIEGEDGTKLIKAGMPVSAAVEIIAELAGALHAAHTADLGGKGIIHRDVKPGNFMLAKDGAVKLMDFGIASAGAEVRTAKTQTDMMVGSVQYMAPERFVSPDAHPSWDVYALGQILYEACAQRRLWKGMTQEMIFRHAFDPAAHTDHVASSVGALDLPEAVEALIADCLAHDASRRPSAHELEVRCRRMMRSLPGQSLWEWVHGHDWTEPEEEEGPLVGHTIRDGTLVETQPPTAPVASASPSQPPASLASTTVARGATWLAAGVAVGMVILVAVLLGVLLNAVMPVRGLWAEADPASVAVPEPAVAPEPSAGLEPALEATVEPSAEATPAPIAGAEPEVIAPTPEPPPIAVPVSAPVPVAAPEPPAPQPSIAVATPSPAPSPKPAPTSAPVGTLIIEGDNVELRGPGGRFTASSEVPAGTYSIYGTFSDGSELAGEATVPEGGTVTVSCNPILARCTAE